MPSRRKRTRVEPRTQLSCLPLKRLSIIPYLRRKPHSWMDPKFYVPMKLAKPQLSTQKSSQIFCGNHKFEQPTLLVVSLCTNLIGHGRQHLRSTLNHIRSARRGRRPVVLLGLGFRGAYRHCVLQAWRSCDHFHYFLLGFFVVTSSFGHAFGHDLHPFQHCLKSTAHPA